MMAAEDIMPDLYNAMPPVRGRLTYDVPLKRYSWFRTGGNADVFFEPADEDDLRHFLAAIPQEIPVTVIGVGSNLLIRDGGISGIVIRLGKAFATTLVNENEIEAGGGATDIAVSRQACAAGLAGLEFLRGIPGMIGGAVRMNAGAYGRDMSDCLIDARIIDRSGKCRHVNQDDLSFSYRHSALAPDAIVVSARFEARPAPKDEITARMAEIAQEREATQPVRTRTGGSTFKNPPDARAWELIDAAGCRGLRIGNAQVSEKHANFLINLGGASAGDIEALGTEVRRRVKEACGVCLEWEIRRVGRREGERR